MPFNQLLNQSPERIALLVVYVLYGDVNYIGRDWKSDVGAYMVSHKNNELADFFYQFLESIGYKMSEEEMQLLSGQHEIYQNHWFDEFRPVEEPEEDEEESA